MKNVTRHLLLAGLSVFVCFFSFCTINDDNGNPVDPGNVNNTKPTDPTFTPGLNVLPDSTYVNVGGTIRIHVQLLSDTDNEAPIRSARIDVATTVGTLSSNRITTDANGWASVILTGSKEGTAEVTFKYGAMQETAFISISDTPPRNMTINASPSVLLADGSSSSIITVQVKNDNNNPIVGDSIRFASSAGMITAASVTDGDGKATAKLTSDKRNTIATVTATLKNDATRNTRINVEFSGVTITAVATPASIRSDGKDTSVVLITVFDAAGNTIVGEQVIFSKILDSTIFINPEQVTNSRGEARVRVIKRPNPAGDARFIDTITVTAAGANAYAVLTYSDNNLTITPRAGQNFIANPDHQTIFDINYVNSAGAGMANAKFEISVTMGMGTTFNPSLGDFTFTDTLIAGSDGKAVFIMQNPSFTSIATIFVRGIPAGNGVEFTTASHNQYFQASAVKKIELAGTPSVISINGQTAKLTATAFDERGNRVKGAIISFNMLSGPGGGEYLEPATATTGTDGTATSYLISGTIPSSFKGVRVKASDFAGNETNTVSLTIAGPPHNITINRNMGDLITYPAAYGKQIAVLVSDVNGNPVADETEVTFSAQVTGYTLFRLQPHFYNDAQNIRRVRVDTVGILLGSEHINKSKPYNPFPQFNDINWNGVPQRWSPQLDHPHGYPSSYCLADVRNCNNPVEPCDPSALAISTDGTRILCNGVFADYNGNAVWDTAKTIYGSYTESELNAMYEAGNAVLTYGYSQGNYTNWDIDWIGNGIAEPQSTVLITRTALTKDGIADNELVYGQSAAWRYRVMVTAECQGFVTMSPEQFILPIEEGAVKYWRYRE